MNIINDVFTFENKDIKIPYLKQIQTINGNVFREVYIIDIRSFTDLELENLFINFSEFQELFLESRFYNELPFRFNMMLYFIYDENRKYNFNFNRIKHDYKYAFKNFITENEIKDIFFNDIQLKEKEVIAFFEGQKITNGFNLIYGRNGSGKTRLLNGLADKLNTQVFNLNSTDTIVDEYVHKKLLKYFDLSGVCINDSDKYFYKLSKILTYCSRNDLPILLDDLSWNSLDYRNQIKLVDILFDYSRAQGTVITTCKSDVKELVKKRVYKPNIIELK